MMHLTQSQKLDKLIELILKPVSDGQVQVDRSMMSPDDVKIRFKSFHKEQVCDPYWPWIGPEKEYHAALRIALGKL